jgi:hypothetical protein
MLQAGTQTSTLNNIVYMGSCTGDKRVLICPLGDGLTYSPTRRGISRKPDGRQPHNYKLVKGN